MADIHSTEVAIEYFPQPEGEAIQVEVERSFTDMFSVIATPPDGAGRRIRGYRRNDIPNKNRTFMKVWQEDAAGTRLWTHQIFGVNEWKIDSATLVVEGADVHILTLAHSYLPGDVDPGTGFRPSAMGTAPIPGVWTPVPPPTPVPVPVPEPPPAPEPCGPDNLNYFRPNDFMTRAQVAQVVARSHGWEDEPDAQVFEDVLPGSTYYKATYNLKRRGIIGGYQCGRR